MIAFDYIRPKTADEALAAAGIDAADLMESDDAKRAA